MSISGVALSSIEEVIEEAKAGRIFILVDDENRENEGDLCIPAENATPEVINFMAKYARGLICLAMQRSRSRTTRLAADVTEQCNAFGNSFYCFD